MEAPAVQLALGRVEVLAELDQAQRQPTRSLALLGGVRAPDLLVEPPLMGGLELVGKPSDLTEGQRGHAAPHGERVGVELAAETELARAGDGALERAVAAAAVADAERGRRGVDIETEAVGVVVELAGETAHQPDRARSEDREPERLDVVAARVVTELVDDGIEPGLDGELGTGEVGAGWRMGLPPREVRWWGKTCTSCISLPFLSSPSHPRAVGRPGGRVDVMADDASVVA